METSSSLVIRAPSLWDRFSRASLYWKAWLVARHPALIWGGRRPGEPEIRLVRALCPPSATMVDVGASFGMWTYHARRHCRSVIAFERLPQLASALARGFRSRVVVHRVALSSEPGAAEITMPQLQWGYSTIDTANDLRGKASEAFGFARFPIEKRTLDSYELRDVGFIKIDVEGHEASVLAGARETLARDRPALVVEAEERHHAGTVAAVSRFAEELGYRRFFLQRDGLHDGAELSIEKHQDCGRMRDYVRNLIFVHDSQLARVQTLLVT